MIDSVTFWWDGIENKTHLGGGGGNKFAMIDHLQVKGKVAD